MTHDVRVVGRLDGSHHVRATAGSIGDERIAARVFHGRASHLGPYPGTDIYGIQRASDGAWAWAFIDTATATVHHVSTWCQR